MAKKPIARITLGFYEDDELDMKLLKCLNKMVNQRYRSMKIKELASSYIKEHMQEIYNNTNIDITKTTKDISNTALVNKNRKKNSKTVTKKNKMLSQLIHQ